MPTPRIDDCVRTKLTLAQFDRLRYVAACGPVIRTPVDGDLERLQLVQPYNGMPSFVEVTGRAIRESFEVGVVDQQLAAAAPALLEACKSTLRSFSQEQWCENQLGCNRCDGCLQYDTIRRAVVKAEGVSRGAAQPQVNTAGEYHSSQSGGQIAWSHDERLARHDEAQQPLPLPRWKRWGPNGRPQRRLHQLELN